MLRRISVLLMSVLVVSALAGSVALAAQPLRGEPGATEQDKQSDPCCEQDRNAWGTVSSDAAIQFGSGFGQHAADPTSGDDQPRLGVGNVTRNDEEQAASLAGTDPTNDTGEGTHVSDHGCVVDAAFNTSCLGDPGNSAPGGA